MASGFSGGFSTPFFTGAALTTLVPYLYDVAVAGRGYMLDRKLLGQAAIISSIRATRAQSDGSQEPGEQSLNPDDLWRRSQQSWHLGAGQTYLDRADSDRRRFRASKGIDVWTEGQISLLNATTETLNATGSNLMLMPAGSRLYAVDGTALKYTTDLSSWTTVTGTSGLTITGIASDGFYVWVADGSNIYRTDTGSSAAALWTATDADVLGYVKGRLMYSDGNVLGYVSDMAAPTLTALFTHADTNWAWVGFAEGPGHIYAAGYAGDKSLIYRISITREGTALDAPTVAGELPDGEVIYAIDSYVGFVFLGTSRGARFCTIDGQGNLTIGALIRTGYPVRCFEGQGEFVWFGWTNYDGTSGGLGRMSLRTFTDTAALKPAYATDLMHTTTANILDVATFNNLRVFAVAGDGFYKEDTANLVASGTIDCGRLGYGISEQKIPLYLDVTFADGFAGTATFAYALNGATSFTTAGAQTTPATSATFALSEDAADQVEVRITLARGSPTTSGPTILRWTVRAQPVPALRRRIVLPLLLHDQVVSNARRPSRWDPGEEIRVLEGWRTTKQVVSVQIGTEQYAAVLEDLDFFAAQPTTDRAFWQGTCVTQFKTV